MFSHPSKLALIDDAHAAGYTVCLHVMLIPEELAVLRVRYRVGAGGHSVPEEKTRGRLHRLWNLFAQAIIGCDTATVYDNSAVAGPRIVAQFSVGEVIGAARWPDWTPAVLAAAGG